MIDTIYIDMDGVIADFSKRYKEKFRVTPEETRSNKEFNGYFKKFIDDAEFSTLDLMSDAEELLQFLHELDVHKEILSSTARPENHGMIAPQKQMWLLKHNIHYKANLVPGKSLKYKYATPNSIIIDDTQSVIDDWNKAGGIGILHTDAKSTIAILKMYL
jgi:phosphoglycolate phosphatase-like HAD superfamily hydrolase